MSNSKPIDIRETVPVDPMTGRIINSEQARYMDTIMLHLHKYFMTLSPVEKSHWNYMLEMQQFIRQLKISRPTFSPPKTGLQASYQRLLAKQSIPRLDENFLFEQRLKIKIGRSTSGVIVITVVLSPYIETGDNPKHFSCIYDCHFCPGNTRLLIS